MMRVYSDKPCRRCGSTEKVIVLAGGPYVRLCEKCYSGLTQKTNEQEEP